MADEIRDNSTTGDGPVPFSTRGQHRQRLFAAARVPAQFPALAEARRTLNRFLASAQRQLQQDEALGTDFQSHVHYAHHLLEPWARLTEPQRAQLIKHLPQQLKDSAWVPPAVRVEAHSRVRGQKPSGPPEEPAATAEWVLRQDYGKIYGTGDPATAQSAVMHIVYPFEDMTEAETYEALRGVLGENQVGIMVVLPEHDKRLPPESQLNAVYDLFNAAVVEFPETPLIVSSHESARGTWGPTTEFLRDARLAANVAGDMTYIPVLSTLGGLGAQSTPITRMGVAKPVVVTQGKFSGLQNRAWDKAVASRRGNYGTKTPGLS